MTYSTGCYQFAEGRHRLHLPFFHLLTVANCITTAVCLRQGASTEWKDGSYTTSLCNQFPIQVRLPLFGLLENIIDNKKPPTVISFHVEAQQDHPKLADPKLVWKAVDVNNILINVISPVFIAFFEPYREWLKDTAAISDWPAKLRFGRVIRNAAAHGGKLNMTDKKAETVTWYNTTYQVGDQGRLVVGGDLQFADIMILMMEISDELDTMKAPLLT